MPIENHTMKTRRVLPISKEHSLPAPMRGGNTGNTRRFTFLELMLALSIVGILASLAIPKYIGVLEKARVARAVPELHAFAREIKGFTISGGGYPDTLAQNGRSTMLDRWESPYQYDRMNCAADVEIANLAKLKLRKKKPPRVLADHDSPSTTSDWHIMLAVDTGDHRDTLCWNGIGSGTSCRWSVRCIPGQSV
jgi:prepilin-type N-terminal cleavage/methylation domain-containing protein